MNRLAEKQERALRRELVVLVGEGASLDSADRLFSAVEISVGRTPLRLTVAGPSAGRLYPYAFLQHVFTRLHDNPIHLFGDPHQNLARVLGQHPYSTGRAAMVGNLLDGTRPLRVYFSEPLRAPDYLTDFDDFSEITRVVKAISLSGKDIWNPALDIANSPDLQRKGILELLRSLDSIQSSVLLEDWLEAIVNQTVSLPEGILPDSPAIAIIKRLLEIDVERGVEALRALLRPRRDLPFRFGYFQLSLTGILLAKLSTASSFGEYRGWIWDEIHYLQNEGTNLFDNFSLGFALLAALLAIAIVVEEEKTEAISLLDLQIKRSLEKAHNPEDKRLFLRFLGDSLSQAVTGSNLSMHLPKLMTFFKHVKDEPSLVRPQNSLLQLIREVFEPARALLTT